MALPAGARPNVVVSRARTRVRRLRTRARARRPPPPGWTVGPPDFVGVGAERSGTTWWYRLVTAHPQVYPAPGDPKERQYFARFAARPFAAADVERYRRQFPRPPEMQTGEWSPSYLCDQWTPPLLARAAPDAKILVILRDPVERYRSGVTHGLSYWRDPAARLRSAFLRGFYAAQLAGLLEAFPREHVLVLQLERCIAEPRAEIQRTFAFLGLDETFEPPDLERPSNPALHPRIELSPALVVGLRAAYRADAARAVDEFGLDAERWPTLSS